MITNPSSPPLLHLPNVTVLRGAPGDRAALDDVTLRIEAGEHVCILGSNGCGKSTLIKTITSECYPAVREGSSMAIFGKERWTRMSSPECGLPPAFLFCQCGYDSWVLIFHEELQASRLVGHDP